MTVARERGACVSGASMRAWMLLLGCGSFGVHAREQAVFEASFAGFDADGDGRVSREEYARVDASDSFAAVDADSDGALTAVELEAWMRVTDPRPLDRAAAVVPPARPGWPLWGRVAAASLGSGLLTVGGLAAWTRRRSGR